MPKTQGTYKKAAKGGYKRLGKKVEGLRKYSNHRFRFTRKFYEGLKIEIWTDEALSSEDKYKLLYLIDAVMESKFNNNHRR